MKKYFALLALASFNLLNAKMDFKEAKTTLEHLQKDVKEVEDEIKKLHREIDEHDNALKSMPSSEKNTDAITTHNTHLAEKVKRANSLSKDLDEKREKLSQFIRPIGKHYRVIHGENGYTLAPAK